MIGIVSAPKAPQAERAFRPGPACDDSDACTQVDICQAGVCAGTNPIVCPLPDPCHKPAACNPLSGTCPAPESKDDGATCDDGDLCTLDDSCQNGVCAPGSPKDCGAPVDLCHREGLCDPATGMCEHPAKDDGAGCDHDRDPCTEGDHCESGACVPGSLKICGAMACDRDTGECKERCAAVIDCAPGKVCDPEGACVDPPPRTSLLDDSGCSHAPPAPATPAGPSAPWLLALAGIAAVARRRSPSRG